MGRLVWAGAVLMLAAGAWGRIHTLDIANDGRFAFSIETFGFLEGGSVTLHVSDWKVASQASTPVRAGFVIRGVDNEEQVVYKLETFNENGICLLDAPWNKTEEMLELPAGAPGGNLTMRVGAAGMYDIIFTRCAPLGSPYSFRAVIANVNPGPNYLSAGEQPLPSIYGLSALAFAALSALWITQLRRAPEKIHTVHHLMTVVTVVRALTVATKGAQLAAIGATGHPTGWSALYYILLVCQSLLFVVTMLLIGTGFRLLKPILSEREKRALAVLVPFQVISSTAIIVRDEIAPGSGAYADWTVVLHLTELACCVAVMLPIAWSIRSLTTAAAADGKARTALSRLTAFRNFFVATMIFLYVTRFATYVFHMTLPFHALYLAGVLTEGSTVAFYLIVGRFFNPAREGGEYSVLPQEDDDDDEEFGLDGGAASAGGKDKGKGKGETGAGDDEAEARSAAAAPGEVEMTPIRESEEP